MEAKRLGGLVRLKWHLSLVKALKKDEDGANGGWGVGVGHLKAGASKAAVCCSKGDPKGHHSIWPSPMLSETPACFAILAKS